jgi:hypothetical protein
VLQTTATPLECPLVHLPRPAQIRPTSGIDVKYPPFLASFEQSASIQNEFGLDHRRTAFEEEARPDT